MSFELLMTKRINDYFEAKGLPGLAYRLKQSKFTAQKCDILVDSRRFYWAIECKTTKYGLFFSANFSTGQVANMTNFLYQTQRLGYLVVRYKRLVSMVPWSLVQTLVKEGKKGVSASLLADYAIDFNDTQWLEKASNRN